MELIKIRKSLQCLRLGVAGVIKTDIRISEADTAIYVYLKRRGARSNVMQLAYFGLAKTIPPGKGSTDSPLVTDTVGFLYTDAGSMG